MSMTAPFPYFGGKRRLASTVWEYLGDPVVYAEPFAGSLAVLLARETAGSREIVCDTNGHISNFWRALRADPCEVAWWADYPTVHQDLRARHLWLLDWARANSAKLSEDPEYYDTKAAGWWVWGISNWVGAEWCVQPSPANKRPHAGTKRGGVGCSIQRLEYPVADEGRPYVSGTSGGRGVSSQRLAVPSDVRPFVHNSGSGQGVQTTSLAHPVDGYPNGARLLDWFYQLAARLSRVVVLNRSWESAVTPTLLQQTRSGAKPSVGIFFDPPYKTDERKHGLYSSDFDGSSSSVSEACYEWSLEHGEKFAIAFCCQAGDFEFSKRWTRVEQSMGGIRLESRKHRREVVYFSPRCWVERQMDMFDS